VERLASYSEPLRFGRDRPAIANHLLRVATARWEAIPLHAHLPFHWPDLLISDRSGFTAMLDRIEGNGVRTVIVEIADRFARIMLP